MRKSLLISLAFLISAGMAMAQDRTVSGKVTSAEDGSPIPGVNIVVKGTTTGAVTDIDGNYKLSVPSDGGILLFSFIGLKTLEITVGTRATIDLSMETDAEQLSEVIVTAVGIEREKRSIGYGIDVIESEELIKARDPNIINSLQGKVTGVQISNTGGNIGGSSKIIIRGVSSLSGRNNPLFIVDGIPMNNAQTVTGSRIAGNRDFANGAAVLNPDDIESMSVLKGAAATALYGSRAAAGAIIITTKKGQTGAGGKPTVSINSTYRMENLFITPNYQQTYAQGNLSKYDSSAIGFDWGPRNIGQTVNYLPITGETGPLQKFDNNGVNDFYETGQTFINNFAISDANDRMDYRFSVTALNQTGILPATSHDRYTFALNAGVKHTKWLQSRFGFQYINSSTVGTGATGANDTNIIGLGSFSSTVNQKSYIPWIDDAGNQINQSEPTTNNPYWLRNENRNDRDDDRFITNMELTFTPIERLSIMTRLGYDYEIDSRLLSNRKGTAQKILGDFTIDNIKRTQLNTDIIANYNTDITETLDLNVLGGFQYNKRLFKREALYGKELLIPELFSPGNVSQTVPTRDFSEQVLFGLYGQIDLDYKKWLTLSVTGRNDWSSTLPLDNNSYFYPSISLAWVFTDAFDISNDLFSYGKLRASYAEVGNDTGPYQLDFNFFPVTTASGQYGLGVNFPFNGAQAFTKSNTVPPTNLQPERQRTYEFGTELKFFNGRLGLDISYFSSRNDDQILRLPIPQSTGFGGLRTNVGRVDNKGLEISLDATPVQIGDFSWYTIVNFSQVNQEVVELSEDTERVIIASAFNSVQVVAIPGMDFQLFAIPFRKDSVSGRPIVDSQEGTRLPGEAQAMGSVLPDFTMGFMNTLSWRGLSLSFTIDWRSGGVMKTSTVEGLHGSGLVEETTVNREGTFIDLDAVKEDPDNPGTYIDNDIPLRSTRDFWLSLNDASIAEGYIFDASYVKLREIAISYSFPRFENSFINQLSVGVEGRNLALLYSKVPHIDPENGLFGAGADGFGIERNSVPSTRSFGVNVRMTF